MRVTLEACKRARGLTEPERAAADKLLAGIPRDSQKERRGVATGPASSPTRVRSAKNSKKRKKSKGRD
jgi:hypothetical protein